MTSSPLPGGPWTRGPTPFDRPCGRCGSNRGFLVHAHPVRRGASPVTPPGARHVAGERVAVLDSAIPSAVTPTPPATYPSVRPATPPTLGDEGRLPFTTMALALRAAERNRVRQETPQLPAQPTSPGPCDEGRPFVSAPDSRLRPQCIGKEWAGVRAALSAEACARIRAIRWPERRASSRNDSRQHGFHCSPERTARPGQGWLARVVCCVRSVSS